MFAVIIKTVIIVGILLTLLYFFPIVAVVGDSMYPTYKDKELLLGRSKFNADNIKVGDVVVFKTPYVRDKLLIKRVYAIHEEVFSDSKSFFMLGDNRDNSNDSRNFGWIDEEDLVAVVINPRERRVYENDSL